MTPIDQVLNRLSTCLKRSRWRLVKHFREMTDASKVVIRGKRVKTIYFLLIGLWSMFRDYEHIRKHNEAKVTNLDMKPGRSYRVAVKLCAITTCYEPLYSDGVLILSSPPTQGKITVEHQNISLSGGPKEKVGGLVLNNTCCDILICRVFFIQNLKTP